MKSMKLRLLALAASLLPMGAAYAASSFTSVAVNKDTATDLDVLWTWKWSGADATPDSSIPALTNWSAEALGWRTTVGSKPKYYLDVSAGPGTTFSFEYDAGIMTSSPNKYTSHSSSVVNGHSYTLDVTPGTNGSSELKAHLVAAVPEPESYAMFLAGLGLMGVIARRRQGA